jgi:hypothetical protein
MLHSMNSTQKPKLYFYGTQHKKAFQIKLQLQKIRSTRHLLLCCFFTFSTRNELLRPLCFSLNRIKNACIYTEIIDSEKSIYLDFVLHHFVRNIILAAPAFVQQNNLFSSLIFERSRFEFNAV